MVPKRDKSPYDCVPTIPDDIHIKTYESDTVLTQGPVHMCMHVYMQIARDLISAYLHEEACNQSCYKQVHPNLVAYVLGGRVGVSEAQCCAR